LNASLDYGLKTGCNTLAFLEREKKRIRASEFSYPLFSVTLTLFDVKFGDRSSKKHFVNRNPVAKG